MSRQAELLQQRALLDREAQSIRRQLALLQDAMKKQRQRRPLQTAQWRGTHREVQYMLCAIDIADGIIPDALTLLEHLPHPVAPRWGDIDRAAQLIVLEDLSLKYDANTVSTWMDHSISANRRRLRELWVVHSEWRTATWTQTLNNDKGVAPSSQKVCAKYRGFLTKAPAALGLLSEACESLTAKHNWAFRWRRRWGGRLGALPVADVEPVDALREKATRNSFEYLILASTVLLKNCRERQHFGRRRRAQILGRFPRPP